LSKRSLPTVVSPIPRDLRTFIDRLRDMLTDGGADRMVTAKDLADAGIASLAGAGTLTKPDGITGTTPPPPTGLSATASASTIFVEWDPPTYSGHAYTEVWSAPNNNLGAAVKVGMTPGGIFVDAVGFDTTRYYWVRFVSIADTAGAFSGVSGVGATTGQEVALLLAALAGQITESQLYTTLGARIDLVDGPDTLSGSVAQRLAPISSQVTTLQASSGAAPGLTRLTFWGFDGGLDGWSSTYATASNGVVTWTPTVANANFIRNLGVSERYIGSKAPVIRARVRRVSGSGVWEGTLFYSTAVHGASTSYRKTISAPSNPDAWNELEWDMSQLTLGGTDYLDNEIRALRIDLVSDANTSVWEFDWVTVGTRNVTPQDVALQTEATVRASETGGLFAQYTVKVDVAGHVSGYGLASTTNGATPISQFGVRANQFFVAPPAVSSATAPTTNIYKGYVWVDTSVTPNVTKYYTGSGWSTTPQALPFVVQTSTTTINGVSVPAGVYINDAYIQNGTITNAKIANLAVDDAKIASLSAGKLTAGSIAVGDYIQSAGYVAGSAGWRIDGNGNAELSNAVVRGTVYATAGEFTGTVKVGTTILGGAAATYSSGTGFYAGLDSTVYKWRVGNPAGARVQWTGSSVEIYNSSNQLTLSSGGAIWSAISGSGKPADGATVGATFGVNIGGQITPSNASTYIANAAIQTAQIGNLAVDTANIAGNAVSATGYVSGTGAAISTTVTVPANESYTILTNGWTSDASFDTAVFTAPTAIVSRLKINNTYVASGSTHPKNGNYQYPSTYYTTECLMVSSVNTLTAGASDATFVISLESSTYPLNKTLSFAVHKK